MQQYYIFQVYSSGPGFSKDGKPQPGVNNVVLRNFDLLWKNYGTMGKKLWFYKNKIWYYDKTMVLYRKLWNFHLRGKNMVDYQKL